MKARLNANVTAVIPYTWPSLNGVIDLELIRKEIVLIILNNDNKQYILDLIQQSNSLIVACLCAAWCDTCNSYQSAFKDLATKHTEYIFLWIDIEDNPEFLGDADIENFPTILIQNLNQTLFFGEQLPYIQHLKRLIENVASNRLPLVTNDAPPLIANILKAVN